jgi:hypothetical protein
VAGCGAGGAGFLWEVVDKEDEARCSIAVPPAQTTVWEVAPGSVAWSHIGGQAGKAGEPVDEDVEDEFDPDAHFMREVAETFLRCVKMRFDQVKLTPPSPRHNPFRPRTSLRPDHTHAHIRAEKSHT